MIEARTTFSNDQAVIDLDTIVKAIAKIPRTQDSIHHIQHNCTDKEFMDLFGITEKSDTNTTYFGIAVHRFKSMPQGEVWLMDKNNNLIGKYNLNLYE